MLSRIQVFFIIIFYTPIFGALHPQHQKLAIIGCGRSGTVSMADMLNLAGLSIGHERPNGKDGVVAWEMVMGVYDWGSRSLRGTRYKYAQHIEFKRILHQVRNPLHVITSWIINYENKLNDPVWPFIRKCVPSIQRSDSLIEQCAKYYYYWNLGAEKHAHGRYRFEDVITHVEAFLTELELELECTLDKQKPGKSLPVVNAWKPTDKKLTWEDLRQAVPQDLFYNLQDMAIRYGYPLDGEPLPAREAIIQKYADRPLSPRSIPLHAKLR